MAHFDEHCNDCIAALGEPFPQVHLWLDEFFPVKGPHHRVVRHHRDGVEEVRKAWGDRAAAAAEVHIKKDCYGIVPSKEQAQLWDMLT
jgi:DNA-binding GntR family transcriptional regulator